MTTNGLEATAVKRTDLARKRKELKAALALAGLTQGMWAAQQGVTPEHLSMVLNGKRESGRLLQELDAFTAKHLARLEEVA